MPDIMTQNNFTDRFYMLAQIRMHYVRNGKSRQLHSIVCDVLKYSTISTS